MDKLSIKDRVFEVIQADPQRENIESISLFGSFLHGDATEASDVDLLIIQKNSTGFFPLMRLQNTLEDSLGRRVQLLTKGSLSRFFRNDVLAEAERIY
jgi:predicted nucleotidyltransferase